MYRLHCKDPEIEKNCRKPSCVYPGVCQTYIPIMRLWFSCIVKARVNKGIKKDLIGSGLRYDLRY